MRKMTISNRTLNLNRQRSYIYNKASNKEDKAKELKKLKLTTKQLNFIKRNYSSLGNLTKTDRIYGATTRNYTVKLPNGNFSINDNNLYGLRGSPRSVTVFRK